MIQNPKCFKFGIGVSEDYEQKMFSNFIESSSHLPRWFPASCEDADPWPAGVKFELRGTGIEDVPFDSFGWFLFSDKLKRLIEREKLTGISLLPIEVESQLAMPVPVYWYAHIRPIFGAIDLEKSMYDRYCAPEGQLGPLMMIKFVLKENVIAGVDVFRCAESGPEVFCSPRFRDLFMDGGCTGLGFRPIRVS